jgi:hypothetical protein
VDWVTMVTHDSAEHIQGPFAAPPQPQPGAAHCCPAVPLRANAAS